MQVSSMESQADGPDILVVEDDPTVCKVYQNALTKRGYQVRISNSFQIAEKLMADHTFDVIISDICLGDKDGLDILESSRQRHPDTPVILVTGMPTIESATTAVRLSAYEYLVKPVPLEELSKAVARAVEFKALKVDQKKAELEKRKYQHELEQLVAARTEKLIQSHQLYQEQNKFLSNVIESLAHPFLVIDAKDFSVKIANTAARARQDIDTQESTCSCYALNHGVDQPCDPSIRRCPVKEVIQTRRSVHLEHIHRNSEGKEAEFEVHAFPLLDDEGEVQQVIQYYIDITEKKRLEAIAEAANLMDNLGYIFAGIRHEIGNPLNSVKMALSVLDKNLDRYPRQTIREFVTRSLSELSRVEYLLKALKNFSMFETPDVEPVDLCVFFNNFKSLVKADFSQKGIHILLDLPSEGILALTDQRAFHQVMLNLMTNAADALEKAERPMIDITVAQIPGFIQVRVRDNGCGMTSDEHKNLFRPFYTSKPHGTGLGLMIVKKMLSKMNSTVTIDSEHQEGTIVTMTLPEGWPRKDEKS